MFSGGGEKPPEIMDLSGQDEEDDAMVPGFSYGGTTKWWGKEEDSVDLGDGGYNQRLSGDDTMGADDFIPGLGTPDQFGGSSKPSAVAPKQSGPLPGQEEMWTVDSRTEDWGNRRGGGWAGRGRGFNPDGPRRGRY